MQENTKTHVGVVGVGYLGAHHLAQYKKFENINLVGCYDVNSQTLDDIKKKYDVQAFQSLGELLSFCDAVSIVTPTITHFDVAKQAISSGCHVLIEKPITYNVNEASELLKLAIKNNKIIQVGHIERFNPAFSALKNNGKNPLFVEAHRISPFNIRGTDVDVILDLMIHDIDILLSLVKSRICDVRASGVSVLSETFDTASARIEFENGCVANLTASRIANKKIRKFRFFEKNSYTTIDFLNPSIETYSLSNTKPSNKKDRLIMTHKNKYIVYDKLKIKPHNALNRELGHFINCVENLKNPMVDGSSGYNALKLAVKIQRHIKRNYKK